MKANTKEQIEEREYVLNLVRELIISSLKLEIPKESLDPDTPLFGTGLGLDSIDAVALVVDLETELGISINEQDNASALRSINTLVDEIIKKKRNDPEYKI